MGVEGAVDLFEDQLPFGGIHGLVAVLSREGGEWCGKGNNGQCGKDNALHLNSGNKYIID